MDGTRRDTFLSFHFFHYSSMDISDIIKNRGKSSRNAVLVGNMSIESINFACH